MNIFKLHNQIVDDYQTYIESFINIRDEQIKKKVEAEILQKKLFPEPLIQFNPSFEKKESSTEHPHHAKGGCSLKGKVYRNMPK